MANCVICGSEIKPANGETKVRRNAKYCSDECRLRGKYKYTVKYIVDRKNSDPEFRSEWNKRNYEYHKRSAARAKGDA